MVREAGIHVNYRACRALSRKSFIKLTSVKIVKRGGDQEVGSAVQGGDESAFCVLFLSAGWRLRFPFAVGPTVARAWGPLDLPARHSPETLAPFFFLFG